jgi:hypothetical protein
MFQIVNKVPEGCKRFISVYQPIAGWKAVEYWWNSDMADIGGFWEPWETGFCSYASRDEAIVEATMWAKSENLPLVI